MNFYLIIFSKYPKSNISQWFFNIFTGKSFFWRFFLILQSAPNFFWRHKEFQKRHFGAKAPLLATVCLLLLSCQYDEIRIKAELLSQDFQQPRRRCGNYVLNFFSFVKDAQFSSLFFLKILKLKSNSKLKNMQLIWRWKKARWTCCLFQRCLKNRM